jgi:cellulose binding protein with CBM2 domain
VQSSTTVNDARSIISGAYQKDWSNYTLELDARKLSGAEGFLIGFAAGSPNNFYWWNLGGWNNTRSVLQRADGGGANEVKALEGKSLETGRDYHVKVIVAGSKIELYLDGVLQLSYTQPTEKGLYQVATRDSKTGDVRVKVVNPGPSTARTSVSVGGSMEVAPKVDVTEIVGSPSDVNTKADPTNVVPVSRTWDGGANAFTYDFPAYSITFLTLHQAPPSCAVSYKVSGAWSGGFNAQLAIKSLGPKPIDGWKLGWTFADLQTVSSGWSATYVQSGKAVTATNLSWNAKLKPGQRTSIGFIGATNGGSNPVPKAFTLNGKQCLVE